MVEKLRCKHSRVLSIIRERLQIDSKKDVLSRETYLRNPINYSEGMADDQKDWYIQYLAEQNHDLRLTSDAMKLVLEDFMAQMKELNERMASMQSKQSDLENQLSEERKLRKSAELKAKFKNIFNGCRDYVNMVPDKITLATSQC